MIIPRFEGQFGSLFVRPAGRGASGLLLLVALGAILAPRTMSLSVWVPMTSFISILGFAAIGQHLVIQQRGFDLSVPGVMSVAAVLVTAIPREAEGGPSVSLCVILAVLAGILSGALSGLAVTVLRTSSIVATIGVNALLLGLALRLSGGSATTAPPQIVAIANFRVFGVPAIFLALVGVTLVAGFIIARTAVGRRFTAVGTSLPAAHILAIPVKAYRTVTYAVAGLFFAIAGILLAGVLNTPVVFSGNPYMLTTVASFVVGGNTFGPDSRNSIFGTIVGAVFLTYLDQVLVSLSIPQSAQSIIQAAIVFAGVALPEFANRRRT